MFFNSISFKIGNTNIANKLTPVPSLLTQPIFGPILLYTLRLAFPAPPNLLANFLHLPSACKERFLMSIWNNFNQHMLSNLPKLIWFPNSPSGYECIPILPFQNFFVFRIRSNETSSCGLIVLLENVRHPHLVIIIGYDLPGTRQEPYFKCMHSKRNILLSEWNYTASPFFGDPPRLIFFFYLHCVFALFVLNTVNSLTRIYGSTEAPIRVYHLLTCCSSGVRIGKSKCSSNEIILIRNSFHNSKLSPLFHFITFY